MDEEIITETNTETNKTIVEYPVDNMTVPVLDHLLYTNKPIIVDFLKKNGEFRSMECTKNTKYIPDEDLPKDSEKKENNDLITVWCIDKEAWRSFYFSNVKRVTSESK